MTTPKTDTNTGSGCAQGCEHHHAHDHHDHSHHMMTSPYVRSSPKVGRNDPCPCGSGNKYKKCCLH